MYCSKCGTELIKDAAFCSSCGEMVKSTKPKKKKEEKKESVKQEVNNSEEIEYQNATQGKRFVNFIFDYIIISAFLIPSLIIVFLPDVKGPPQYITYYLLIFLYFFLFEALTGKTLGKLITRTKVLNLLDEKPSAVHIFYRTIGRFIPFDIFSYLSSRPVGWHDSVSKTYVAEKVPS